MRRLAGNGGADIERLLLDPEKPVLLVVTNWFDGIVVDRLWVGRGRLWSIPGMEGISYVKPWKTVLTKRALSTIVYLIISLAVAGLAAALGKLL